MSSTHNQSQNPVMDTPTRASRASRPQTRAWKQLISDATNRSTSTSAQRARLRAHLAAADRLASKRRALRQTQHPNVVKPPHGKSSSTKPSVTSTDHMKNKASDVCDYKHGVDPKQIAKKLKLDDDITKPTSEEEQNEDEQGEQDINIEPLFPSDATWTDQIDALHAYAKTPSPDTLPAFAAVLPQVLRDLRGQIVVAGADATVAAAKLFKDRTELLSSVLDAAFKGAAVTKRVMADPCERATLALLSECSDAGIWGEVLSKLRNDDHTATRCLVVKSVKQLVEDASPTRVDFIARFTTECLSVAATDKMVQVRDVARTLLTEFRSRFGEERTDKVLANAIPSMDARTRFVKPADRNNILGARAGGGGGALAQNKGMKRQKPKSSNIRELIKQRRAAAAAAAAKQQQKSSEEAEMGGNVDSVAVVSIAGATGEGVTDVEQVEAKASVPTTIR